MTQQRTFIPIHRPQLPTAEDIFPYLKRIDEARWYSNFGQLLREFEARTASLFDLLPTQITTAGNGTLVLTAILRALDLPANTLCLMPSWTFIATAAAAHYAGLVPYFVDVDAETQALDPEQTKEAIKHAPGQVSAVIVVAPFGAPINQEAWAIFQNETGIPVIIDAAAGFDAVMNSPSMRVGIIPTMVSLHATKVFGIGEGGIVISKDKELIQKIKSVVSFGFHGGREAQLKGMNAKLSEYSAAVGLASLDNWNKTRISWQSVRDFYIERLNKNNIVHFLNKNWISGTCNVLFPGKAKLIGQKLIDKGIDTRQWWLDGCHKHEAYQHFPKMDELEVTNWLSDSVIGLPYSIDITKEQIDHICDVISEINSISDDKKSECQFSVA